MLRTPTGRIIMSRVMIAAGALIAAVVSAVATQRDAFNASTIVPMAALLATAVPIYLFPWGRYSHNWIAKVYLLGAVWFVYFAIHLDTPYLLLGLFPIMVGLADAYAYRKSLVLLHEAVMIGVFVGAAAVIGGHVAATLVIVALPLMTMKALLVGAVSHGFIETLLQREQFQSAVTSLLEALQARDGYTGEHSRETLAMAMAVADELRLDDNARRELADVALLHDVGKIGIPNAILQKPGKLTADEWETMRRHPVIGEQLLRDIPGFEAVAKAVRHEHERWDGDGYPDGLAGDEIPIASRIVLVCDAYHAMTSDRPYRRAMTSDAARAELRENAGTQFDPRVVEALDSAIEAGKIELLAAASDKRHAKPAQDREYEPAGSDGTGRWEGSSAPVALTDEVDTEQRRDSFSDPRVMIMITSANWAVIGIVMTGYLLFNPPFDQAGFVTLAIAAGFAAVGMLFRAHGAPRAWNLYSGFLGYVTAVLLAARYDEPALLVLALGPAVTTSAFFWHRAWIRGLQVALVVGLFVCAPVAMFGWDLLPLSATAIPAFPGTILSIGYFAQRMLEMRFERKRFSGTMASLLLALEARDGYTSKHSNETLEMAMLVADKLELDEDELLELEDVALLHDIGKIGIPDEILHKPGALTDDEWEIMRRHPLIGEQIVARVPGFASVARAIRHEHERWDGKGYPDGISGEDIPLASRIVLVCDAYHAMTSNRPYRKAMDESAARAELVNCAGTQFDPRIVNALLAALAERDEHGYAAAALVRVAA